MDSLNKDQIRNLLPHREPMLLVDELYNIKKLQSATALVNVKKETYRFLQGFRGSSGDWDWETAFVTSKATSDDVTSQRMSNNLLKEALYDSTPAAYNPFSAGVDSNIERTLIDVYRKGSSELTMFDFKISNNLLYLLSM